MGKAIYNFILIPLGFFKAFGIIFNEKPKLVVSFGGYLAVPLVINAWLLKIPTMTHEQTITTGLANKIIAKYSNRILVSWQQTFDLFPKKKTILTGNPVREEVLSPTTSAFEFERDLPLLMIMGGNQGSHAINSRITPIIKTIIKDFNIVHITGNSSLTDDHENALETQKNLPQELQEAYRVEERVFGEAIGELLNKADLMITRAGANTITEQLVLGKRAILIPIPWASQNEQYKNAKVLEEIGLGKILNQNDHLTSQLLLNALEEASIHIHQNNALNGQPMEQVVAQAKQQMPTDAVEKIYTEVINLL